MIPRLSTGGASCLALLVAPSLAHAQTRAETRAETRPADAPAAPPELAPRLYDAGNLRVAVRCAESFETPERGLRVSLDSDSRPLRPLRTNGETWLGTDAHGHVTAGWVTTDVGYLAPLGSHRLRIEAPDCVPEERDVVLTASHAEYVDGRLLVARPVLEGPVGAPDGLGILLGGYTSPYPESLRSGVHTLGLSSTAYTIDPASTQGFWLSTSFERRFFALAFDATFGAGQLTGTMRSLPGAPTMTPIATRPLPFSGSFLDGGLTLRVGARVPLRYATLEAGSGIGGSVWVVDQAKIAPAAAASANGIVLAEPPGANAAWHVPLWAAVTLKPFCGVGVQALASYDAEPDASWHGGVLLGAGLLLQPSASCAETATIDVKP
jgi:hypothetical protein